MSIKPIDIDIPVVVAGCIEGNENGARREVSVGGNVDGIIFSKDVQEDHLVCNFKKPKLFKFHFCFSK